MFFRLMICFRTMKRMPTLFAFFTMVSRLQNASCGGNFLFLCIFFIGTDPNSFSWVAKIYLRYFFRTKVPCLFVASKTSSHDYDQTYEFTPSDFCLTRTFYFFVQVCCEIFSYTKYHINCLQINCQSRFALASSAIRALKSMRSSQQWPHIRI